MKGKSFYAIILPAIIAISMLQCKKSKTGDDTPPVTDPVISYEVSTAVYPNTERGFIKTYPVYAEGASLDLPQLKLLRGQNISMILRNFYLDKFKTQAISSPELALIQADLDKAREAGLKVILRFAYTDEMTGTDAALAIVEQHLDQLKPLFEANKDVIAFVQAGLIGAYGEWHDSSNGLATEENERKVLTKLLSVLPLEIMVQVRTPGQKQAIFNSNLPVGKDIAYTAEGRARVGHHNDCFLTGGTEYGTYNNIIAEKQYISNDALYVPVGGETCPPAAGYSPDCAAGRTDMKSLKWTYLNLDWYPATINAWKISGCFDEFQTYLGHRLALLKATLPDQSAVNGELKLNITLSNRGYAPLYNKKNTLLVLKNKGTGQFYDIPLSVDVRDVKPLVDFVVQQTVNLSGIPAGDYDLYLKIADQASSLKDRPEYAVRLANTGVWVEDHGGMNSLKHVIKIAAM
ncbi:MAG TPA: DUF4832 domain-containing protein [Chitinophagaceae bacterium]|nr:DUF4832 domain-containing protein [Chitinophagaceae bacterium]